MKAQGGLKVAVCLFGGLFNVYSTTTWLLGNTAFFTAEGSDHESCHNILSTEWLPHLPTKLHSTH